MTRSQTVEREVDATKHGIDRSGSCILRKRSQRTEARRADVESQAMTGRRSVGVNGGQKGSHYRPHIVSVAER